MQLELFPWEVLTATEKQAIIQEIRNGYWYLRHYRSNYQQADRRRIYRRIEGKKKRLRLAGVEKREVLDLLRCCRLQCSARRHPFKPCKYCP
jgi:hypothetical protein